MTSASSWSVALIGMEGRLIEVEAAITSGLPKTILVGLPDASLYEARDRCRAAVTASGWSWPSQVLTINLSPATLPKAGSHYDLAIVAAVWGAADIVPREASVGKVLLGELGLDGRIRPVRGVLPAVLAAQRAGITTVIVPLSQVHQARLVDGVTVWGVEHLTDLVEVLHGRPPACGEPAREMSHDTTDEVPDLADVAGQLEGRWALEVAAAGRHHLALGGPPGVGKTMLAQRLPGLLPRLTVAEQLEVAAIRSLAAEGFTWGPPDVPPFADPHHSASMAAIVGGGQKFPQPGAVSLAHRGVLFLDEAPEFNRRVLEALRTPLEHGRITLGRAAGQATYPAAFQLVLASNPCPCGNARTAGRECRCSPNAVRLYAQRLSGPILDRIDLHCTLQPLPKAYLARARDRAESTAVVAARVAEARDRQRWRLHTTPWSCNGDVPGPYLRAAMEPRHGIDLVDAAVERGWLSPRGVDKVIKVAWTIADLGGHDEPTRDDVHAALDLRRAAGEAAA